MPPIPSAYRPAMQAPAANAQSVKFGVLEDLQYKAIGGGIRLASLGSAIGGVLLPAGILCNTVSDIAPKGLPSFVEGPLQTSMTITDQCLRNGLESRKI
jgi:hypothetical protein